MSYTLGRVYTPYVCAKCQLPQPMGDDQTENPLDDEWAKKMEVPKGSRVCWNCVMELLDKEENNLEIK